MGKDRATTFSRPFRMIFDIGAVAGLTDGELLDRFGSRRGESAELAFAAILERHGPMVFRVCRKILGDHHDALDAFQATFLVLVQQAHSVRKADSIASWLHGVALRVASSHRAAEARRRSHETRAVARSGLIEGGRDPDELGPLLHQELDRLHERYRAPLILCHLEGMTHEEAAERLGWPVGTVKSRMARGRDRLKIRLSRRGIDSPACWSAVGALKATPPLMAMDATARAATRLAAGRPISGIVPKSAIHLMQGVRRTMILNKLKLVMSAMLAAGIVATAAGVLAQQPEPVPTAGPVPAPVVEPGIRYETNFVDMIGLEWRTEFHKQLNPIARKGPYTVWAIDLETLKRILERGKLVTAPKVTAFVDADATISTETKTKILAGFKNHDENFRAEPGRIDLFDSQHVVESPTELRAGNGVVHPAKDVSFGVADILITKPSPEVEMMKAKAMDIAELADGVRAQFSGHRVKAGILVKGEIESNEIISLATSTVRETVAVGQSVIEGNIRLQIPEVIQSRFEGEWLVPDDVWLIVGMGIHHIQKPGGVVQVRERLIAFKASAVELDVPSAKSQATPSDPGKR